MRRCRSGLDAHSSARERAPEPSSAMDRSLPGPDHGDRAGTHRVPAGLLVRAPHHRAVPVRLGRRVHHVAGVQRDAPPRDARRAARLLPGGLAPARPGRVRDHPRPLVPWRPGPEARVAAGRRDHPGRHRRLPVQRRHRDRSPPDRPRRRACSSSVAAILWLADRCRRAGRKDVERRDVPDRRRASASPRRWRSSRASAARASRSRPAGSPAWTARPRPRVQLPDGDADHRRARSCSRRASS